MTIGCWDLLRQFTGNALLLFLDCSVVSSLYLEHSRIPSTHKGLSKRGTLSFHEIHRRSASDLHPTGSP